MFGFGINAHSYIDNIRYSNTKDLEEYIFNCNNNNFEKNKIIEETQNLLAKEQEYMLLGLRKIDGVNINEFKIKFGENPVFLFKSEFNKLVNENLIEINLSKIRLTNKGLNLANLVWREFVK